MKPSIKHNKLRNTGILFELLVRQITADVMENKQNSAAVRLMREFFNSKKELGKELVLYRAFFNVQNLSEQKAFELLKLITEQRKKLNQNLLNEQKYNLIKEIKNNFDLKEFFAVRVPSYKIYASIYKNFDVSINGLDEVHTIEELANSQFTIVEHLCGTTRNKEIKEHTDLSNVIRNQENDVRFLSYKILIEKFNQKYEGLNDKQKKLLQEYIYNTSNSSRLKTYIQAESMVLSKQIKDVSNKVEDKVVRIKLTEVVSQLKKMQTAQTIKENHMVAMLIAYEILKELKSL
jgi:hypothetical protein